MKTRQEIKALAKEAFKEQRTASILIMLLVVAIVIVAAVCTFIPILGYILYAAILVAILPFSVGVYGAFLKVYRREKIEAAEPLQKLSINFTRKLGGMLWVSLWEFLWMLLLIVPGIIKSISYSMTVFILSDCPNVNAKDAIKLSMRMTDGHKAELFVLYLSFIGWAILSGLTLGILLVVFTGPYMYTTFSGYYIQLRDQAIASGKIKAEELQ